MKASQMVSEIAAIEQRCEFLEQRNKWLTEKLLRSQRSFIERTMMANEKGMYRTCFKMWKDCLDLMRTEHQLEQQTASLDKCQQVAKELGQALAREQEVSRKESEARRQLEIENEQLADTTERLKQFADKQELQNKLLQRQLTMAMQGLSGVKSDAQASIDTVDALQARIKDLGRESTTSSPDRQEKQPPRSSLGLGNTIEESMLKRDEAQVVMSSMSSLLSKGNESPDSRQTNKSRGEVERTTLRGTRTPSPLDSRFQSVNQIMSELEQAPPTTSGNEMVWASQLSRSGDSNSVLTSPLLGSRDLLGGSRTSADGRPSFFGRTTGSAAATLLKR
jgi:hypothetical protein